MSKITKRKHVTKEIVDDFYVPEGDEAIAQVVGGRGNNLHEVSMPDGNRFLVSMPNKFRKNVWIKRGDFVIIEPIKEGNKVQGEIVYVLYTKQIKYHKEEGYWPEAFENESKPENGQVEKINASTRKESEEQDSEGSSASSDDEELFKNPNHRPPVYYTESDTSTDSEDEDQEETCVSADESGCENNNNTKEMSELALSN